MAFLPKKCTVTKQFISQVAYERYIFLLFCFLFLIKLHHGTKTCQLLDVMCDDIPLRDLLRKCTLHNLPEGISLQTMFLSHHAIMSQTRQLANVGDFVKITSTNVR